MATIEKIPIQPINNWWGVQTPITPPTSALLNKSYNPSPYWSAARFTGPYQPIACTSAYDVFDPVKGYLGRNVTYGTNQPIPLTYRVTKTPVATYPSK